MGHDIYARPKDALEEIAYFRLGAFNENVETVYGILEAESFNLQLSGNGKKKSYSADEIVSISKKISHLKGFPYESLYKFLGDIYRWLVYNDKEEVEIWFC